MRGLILRLQKRHQSSDVTRFKKPEYLMWGYYDRLGIDRVEKWQDLEPTGANANSTYNHFKEFKQSSKKKSYSLPPYHEEYQLKLIEPDLPEERHGSADENTPFQFEYDIWHQEKSQNSKRRKTGAFIAIGMLHFTGDAISEALLRNPDKPQIYLNNLLQKSIEDVARHLKMEPYEFNELCCSTYYTTGFSDMVVLFRTMRLDFASNILYGLRSISTESGKAWLLSTAYVMCGRKENLQPEKLIGRLKEAGNNLRFSIRFLLKPGITPEQFFHRLSHYIDNDRIGKIPERQNELLDLFQKELKAYSEHKLLFSQMFGYSDLLLLPEVHFPVLLGEYADKNGFLNSESSFYRENILSTRTSLRCIPDEKRIGQAPSEFSSNETGQEKSNVEDEIIKPCLKGIKKYIEIRQKALLACNAVNLEESSRLWQGIRQVLSLYKDIAQPEHSYDIRSMLDPAVTSLGVNMDMASSLLRSKLLKIKRVKDTNSLTEGKISYLLSDMMRLIHNVDEGLSYFRHEFNELLLDFLRADRKFIEGRSLLHSAVGSATKLILAYSYLLQKAITCLHSKEELNGKCTYSFMLCCGGAHETKATHIFPDLNPQIKKGKSRDESTEHVLLQIKLPERTLFRTGAAVYFLLHELLHYVGNRFREDRAVLVQKSVAAYTVYLIADNLYKISPEQRIRMNSILGNPPDSGITIINLQAQREKMKFAFEEYFRSAITNILLNKKNKFDYFTTYSRHLRDKVVERMEKILVPRYYDTDTWDTPADAPFPFEVADWFCKDASKDGAFLADRLAMMKYPFVAPYLMVQELTLTNGLSDHLQMKFDSLINNYFTAPVKDKNSHPIGDQMIESAVFASIQTAVDQILNSYNEAYSDATTYRFLNCRPWEYLSIFLYENEVPVTNVLSPLYPHVVMRIGAVLTVCDDDVKKCMECSDSDKFTKSLNLLLDAWTKNIKELGLWSPVQRGVENQDMRNANINEYVKHIGKILRAYWEIYRAHKIAEPLEDYVNKCGEYMKSQFPDDSDAYKEREKQRSLFHDGLIMSNDQTKQDQVWAAILNYWMNSSIPL